MNTNTAKEKTPRKYQVSFDATIPNVHPASLPDERQRVAITREVISWDAADAIAQVKIEAEKEYREDKSKPHWKAVNAVNPAWEAVRSIPATTRLREKVVLDLGSTYDPIALLRRIGTKGEFMDLEGLRITASDFIAKWDVFHPTEDTQ